MRRGSCASRVAAWRAAWVTSRSCWIVLGEETFPNPALIGTDESLDERVRAAISCGTVEVLSETELWQRMGLVESQDHVQRLYTPAMLAELLEVPVSVIRRWHRRGLIVPAREVRRLAYFDFREVATARRLAELLSAGMSPAAIEARLDDVRRLLPDVERPLEQLSVIAEGKDLLLRQGDGLVDSGGQRRFDFDASVDDEQDVDTASVTATDMSDAARENDDAPVTEMKLPEVARRELEQGDLATLDVDALMDLAADAEDDGEVARAIELYRTALSAGGPSADICFPHGRVALLPERVGRRTGTLLHGDRARRRLCRSAMESWLCVGRTG